MLACPSYEKYRLKGCKGGRPSKVMDYISDQGLNIERNYPYDGTHLKYNMLIFNIHSLESLRII